MTDNEKIEVLQEAFRMACQFIRENPASSMDAYFDLGMDAVKAICGGIERDPKGEEFQLFFLQKAIDKLL